MLPQATYTIEQFIESGKGVTISYFNLSFLDKMSNGIWTTVLNVVNDYIPELIAASNLVELKYKEQEKYFYKPKLLCYDIYGNPELYFIVLLMNDMADVKEFTKSRIRLLKKSYMSMLLTEIFNAERVCMEAYNTKDKEQA